MCSSAKVIFSFKLFVLCFVYIFSPVIEKSSSCTEYQIWYSVVPVFLIFHFNFIYFCQFMQRSVHLWFYAINGLGSSLDWHDYHL